MSHTTTAERCHLAPEGWRCNLEDGHDGPCPLWPDTWYLRLKCAIKYQYLNYLFARHVDWDMVHMHIVWCLAMALALIGLGYTAALFSWVFGTHWAGLIFGAVVILLASTSPNGTGPR